MAKRPLFGPPLLRPFKKGERRPNADGSFSTEISMSAPDPFGHGQWMNFPSLWMGPNGPVQLLDDGAALNAAVNFEQFGSSFPRFATRQQAEKIAEDRSKAGGVGTGELAAPTNDKAGQDMSPYGLLYPGFMGQRFALPMQDDLSRLPPDRGLIGGDMPGQGPLPGPYELAAMRRPAPKPMPRARQVSGKPDGAGRPGEIRTGADGRNYQYAETTGMAGATGPQGWLQTNMPAAPQASPQSAPAGPLGGLFAPDNRDVLAALGIGMMRGDFSGGMADALKIKQGRAQENATRAWLMKRGLSAEDAAMAAQNPSLMSMLLKPGETDKYAERAAAAKQYGLQEGTPEWQQFTLTGELPSARGGAAEMSLNTIPIVLENGEAGLLQVDKAGEGHITKIPGGAKIAKAPIVKDTGTEFQVIDPVTREVVQTIPKNVRGAAAETAIGQQEGAQAAAAPADIAAGQNALAVIGDIRNDPYLDRGTGGSSLFNGVWGTGGYDFQNAVDQAKSGAFLTAIQQMRGLGSLSNAEGDTASKAVTRMNTALSKEAFLKALDDYEAIVKQGMQRAAARQQQYGTGVPGQQPAPAAPPAQGGNRTSNGVQWNVEQWNVEQ